MIVRIILPAMRKDVVATRRRKCEIARKMSRYLLLGCSGEAEPSRMPGVILLTFTA
jgi:hypothetical protein